MPEVEANGKTFNFPEGTTDEQMGQAIDEYFSQSNVAADENQFANIGENTAEALRGASNEAKELIQSGLASVGNNIGLAEPSGPLPFGMTQEIIDSTNANTVKSNARKDADRNNPDMLMQIAQANKDGFWSNAAKSAKHVTNQLLEGTDDLIDQNLPEWLSNLGAYRIGGETEWDPEKRIAQRADVMNDARFDQHARDVGAPFASISGSVAPYLVTGGALSRGMNAAASAMSPMTQKIAQGAMGRISTTEASHMANTPRISSDFGRRAFEVAKAPAIGAIEGGMNYDLTAGQGAAMSGIGAIAGAIGPVSRLSRVENVNDANTRAIIRDMHADGFSLTPGVRTGNRQMQTEEAGIRNSDVLGDYFHQSVTRPNQRRMTEMAGDAIGLSKKGRDTFSVDELSSHLASLSSQYGKLELETVGRFTPAHLQRTASVLRDLKPTPKRNTGPEDLARYQSVKSIVRQLMAETNPVGHGANKGRTFTGEQYQKFREKIQDQSSKAFVSGDRQLGKALNNIKQSLDEAIEGGMGRTNAKQWRDLNEKYAMTNMLIESGITPAGRIDPTGITSSVMNGNEAIRTLTGRGGRIKEFQKIARYNDVLNNVEGGSLTGLGSADFAANRSLNKLPFRYKLPLYARATGAARLSRLPTMGLGPTAGVQLGRATGMTDPIEKSKSAADAGIDYIKSLLGN